MNKSMKIIKSLNEQKFWEVEIEYEIVILVNTAGINLDVDIPGLTEIEKVPVGFPPQTIKLKDSKTVEIEANTADEAKRKVEKIQVKDLDLSLYSGEEYLTEGFGIEVDEFKIKVLSVNELGD